MRIYEKKSQVSPASLNGGSSFQIERPRVVTHDEHRREITNHNKYHRSIARTLTVGCVYVYMYATDSYSIVSYSITLFLVYSRYVSNDRGKKEERRDQKCNRIEKKKNRKGLRSFTTPIHNRGYVHRKSGYTEHYVLQDFYDETIYTEREPVAN